MLKELVFISKCELIEKFEFDWSLWVIVVYNLLKLGISLVGRIEHMGMSRVGAVGIGILGTLGSIGIPWVGTRMGRMGRCEQSLLLGFHFWELGY